MEDAKQQLIDKLKTAANVLVTVSRNPSVDQLASCIGLSLLLNKQGKHAAAVFSGEVPSTLEFLQPEETLEKNTDSLRDFIIALDKSKADKLRYKVEDNVVRIFITPYKTSISQADLEFSEGDFNVDVVIALGVRQQEDLDEAITSHGRILHDATVASISTAADAGLGSIIWSDPQASSLSELVAELAQAFGDKALDQQIATALLTGVVAETERFSNDKTSSQTMSISAALMAAGANQQLVASKLEEEQVVSLAGPASADASATDQDVNAGMLRIEHVDQDESALQEPAKEPPPETGTAKKSGEPSPPSPYADHGLLDATDSQESAILSPEGGMETPSGGTSSAVSGGPKIMTEPPSMGGTLTANSKEEGLEPTSDPFSLPSSEPPQLLDRKSGLPTTAAPAANASSVSPVGPTLNPAPAPAPDPSLPLPDWVAPATSAPAPTPPSSPPGPSTDDGGTRTLSALEESVDSPHLAAKELDTARDEVNKALAGAADSSATPDEPLQGLSAQPLGGALHDDKPAPPASTSDATVGSPPPVPPPIPFQFGNSPPPNPPQ